MLRPMPPLIPVLRTCVFPSRVLGVPVAAAEGPHGEDPAERTASRRAQAETPQTETGGESYSCLLRSQLGGPIELFLVPASAPRLV